MKVKHEPSDYSLEGWLAMKAQERQEKYKTIIQDYFPDIFSMRERVYYGVLSWTLVDSRERWLRPSAVVNIGNGIQTGGEIARDYLDWKFPNRLRATKAQKDALNFHRSAPLYCTQAVLEYGAYVDLKSAYWSIMNLIGWDVDYYPSKWLVQGTIPSDFPLAEHKVARNTLVSCGLPTPVKLWTGSRMVKQYSRNNHINMGLWACIMDILHAIASQARRLGACYIHTDGYILEAWHADELIAEIEKFGLHASVKARGVSSVIGIGNYRVGEKATKGYGRETTFAGDVENVYLTQANKLRAKLYHLSQNKGIIISRQELRDVRE